FQVGIIAETWAEAQIICRSLGRNIASVHNAQVREFLHSLAVSRGLVNGVLLGATVTGKSNTFGWIDGSQWDYENFQAGFPIDGIGECLAMVTNDAGGKWINIDCSTEIPFVCERSGDFDHIHRSFKSTYIMQIYSPGFPNDASVSCDYFLEVDANKLVEVEILFLEANSCCDHLVLFEGTFGGNIIANLTGEISAGTTFRTNSSNFMRASWQPNGGVNVRGMMVRW
ncbi:hypothetical protein PFISCL1PPCAC_5036, partial [Pristionchus fissidentatus]